MSEGSERRFSRRSLLVAGGAAAGLAATGIGIERLNAGDSPENATYPFYGEQQSGITTPAQEKLHFAAFDLRTEDPNEIRELMKAWTAASARDVRGRSRRRRERESRRAARGHGRGARLARRRGSR